jgi:hypothetical protein
MDMPLEEKLPMQSRQPGAMQTQAPYQPDLFRQPYRSSARCIHSGTSMGFFP